VIRSAAMVAAGDVVLLTLADGRLATRADDREVAPTTPAPDSHDS